MAIKRRIRNAKELINAKQSKNIGGFLSKLEHSDVADVPDIVDVLDVLDVVYVLDVPWTCRTSWTCRASRTGRTSCTCQTSQKCQSGFTVEVEAAKGKRREGEWKKAKASKEEHPED